MADLLSNGVKKGDERQHVGNQTMEYKFNKHSGDYTAVKPDP